MIIKTEAAAVTIKRNGASYNNDSININGKVPSLDSANAGYKGAGSMSAPFAVALSSSERNGFAAAALTAFNDRLPMLKQSGEDFAQILSDYFCDSEYALEKSQCSSSVLATSVLYGYGCNIVAARMGSSRLYRYADGTLTSIGLVMKPGEDHVPFSSCELIENVGDGEIYVLCSGGVFSVLTDEEISSVLASCEGSAKRAAQALTTAALSREGSEDAVSIIVLKVDADGEPAVAPILPVTPEEAAAALSEEAEATALSEEQEANLAEEETRVIPEEELPEQPRPEEEPPVSKANKTVKRLLTVILIICGMIVLTFATYKIASAIKNRAAGKTGETTTAETTLEESTTEEPTTEAQNTTEQNTTEPAATSAPTTAVPVITPPATTRRPSSTARPTQAPTTHREEPVSTTEPTGETEITTAPEEPSGEAESTSGTLETNTPSTAAITEAPTVLSTSNTQAASTAATTEALG